MSTEPTKQTPLQPNGRGIEIALELLELSLLLQKEVRNVDPRIIH
jgi:hypothetical protein